MTEETIIRYVADDGKAFDDEDECREYEGSLYAKDVSFFKFAEDGVNIKKMLPTSEKCIETCDIIAIKTIEGAEWVNRCCYNAGIELVFNTDEAKKTGIFVYNERSQEWDDWEEYFKRMTAKNEQMIKLLNL